MTMRPYKLAKTGILAYRRRVTEGPRSLYPVYREGPEQRKGRSVGRVSQSRMNEGPLCPDGATSRQRHHRRSGLLVEEVMGPHLSGSHKAAHELSTSQQGSGWTDSPGPHCRSGGGSRRFFR